MAARAREVLVGRMCLHVRTQVGTVSERLTAVSTSERLFASMGTQMSLQQPGPREQLPAHTARVRQFMRQEMHCQRRHADVCFPARDTLLC